MASALTPRQRAIVAEALLVLAAASPDEEMDVLAFVVKAVTEGHLDRFRAVVERYRA